MLSTRTMCASFPSVLDAIVYPESENAPRLLDGLGLADIPSRERVHREIEQRLLLPQEKLPEDWLPLYQACVGCLSDEKSIAASYVM